MNPSVKSNAIRYGLIIAAIGIGYTLLGYLIDLNLLVLWWSGILLFILNMVLLLIAVRKTREDLGGFIEFREVFSVFMVTYIISSALTIVFTMLLFGVVDKAAGEELNELVIEANIRSMENFGAPHEVIEKQIETLEGSNSYSIGSQARTFLWGIVIYAVIGLIVAAIMKKSRPAEYIDESEEV